MELSAVSAIIASLLSTALGYGATSGVIRDLFDALLKKQPLPDENGIVSSLAHTLPPNRTAVAQKQVAVRLNEARRLHNRERSTARWQSFADKALTFSHYVIGAMMATSFVQKSLTPTVIGWMGLIVVASSAIKQHYHPDIAAQNAAQKASQLDALIRQGEDRVVVLETTRPAATDDPLNMLDLLEHLTADITKVIGNNRKR